MKIIALILLTVFIFLLTGKDAEAAIFTGDADVDELHPNKCWSKELQEAFDVGSSWYLQPCIQATCYRRDSRLIVELFTCGVVSIHGLPHCRLEEDFSKNYPACCPTPVCFDEPDSYNEIDSNQEKQAIVFSEQIEPVE